MDARKELMELGMKLPFLAEKANFSGFFNEVPGERLYIDRVIHQAVIEVNEAGSEAAAATAVAIAEFLSLGSDTATRRGAGRSAVCLLHSGTAHRSYFVCGHDDEPKCEPLSRWLPFRFAIRTLRW